MDLTKRHREGLLRALADAKKESERNKFLLNSKELAEDLKELFEIDAFLSDQRIILIEQSLIDNEIDF